MRILKHAFLTSLAAMAVLVSSAVWAAASPQWTVGAGFESRLNREVNPDYTSLQSVGQLFGEFRIRPLSWLLEVDRYQKSTGSGNYRVKTTSYETTAWMRYEPWDLTWSPYGGLGLGWGFDKVQTALGDQSVSKNGNSGWLVGASVGLIRQFYPHMLMEVELRANTSQSSKDLYGGAAIRAGFVF